MVLVISQFRLVERLKSEISELYLHPHHSILRPSSPSLSGDMGFPRGKGDFPAKACISENYALSLPAKGGDMKANGTRWGWQIPRFGTSGLQIRWSGEFFYALISRFVLFIPLFYEKIFIFATNLKI